MKVSLRRIAPVEITDVKVEETSVTLTWSGFDTAKHYELFKRTGSGDQVKIGTFDAKTLSYVDTEIEKNAVYCYAVRQLTSHGESPLPEERSVATMSTKLDSASVKNSPSGVVVSWSGNTDFAVGVNIYRSVAGGKWTLAGTVGTDESSFTDTGAKYGKTAKYKVTLRLNDTAEGEAKSAGSVYAVDPDKTLVALTYDDGPYSPVTNVILDTMEKYGAHCTFFVVGNRVENYNSCVTRAASLGCEIGSHTYQHKYFNQISSSEVRYQLDEAKKVIEKYSGTKCTILRPPGGHVVSGIDYPLIMWSVDTMDWSNRNKDTTLARAKSGVFDGSIVLMHDLYESSGEATVSLVPWLIKNGYQLVTVSELMEARGITMVNGVKYSQARKTN